MLRNSMLTSAALFLDAFPLFKGAAHPVPANTTGNKQEPDKVNRGGRGTAAGSSPPHAAPRPREHTRVCGSPGGGRACGARAHTRAQLLCLCRDWPGIVFRSVVPEFLSSGLEKLLIHICQVFSQQFESTYRFSPSLRKRRVSLRWQTILFLASPRADHRPVPMLEGRGET